MSLKIEMPESNGDGHSQEGNANQHQSSFGFQTFQLPGQQRRRSRKSQLQKNGDEEAKAVKAFTCMEPGCPRSFSSRFKLVRHVSIHSGDKRFQCTNCGRRFHRKDHLKNHLQVHNPNKKLHCCELCQKSYSSPLSYRKHLALHAAEAGDLVCKLCGKVQTSREGIMHHLKVHTGSRTLRGPSERKFPCDRCDRSFFTKKDVKRHLVVHTGKRDFVCQFCPQRFGRKDHLVRHTKKSHIGVSTNNPSTNGIIKYEPPSPVILPTENHKSVIVQSQLSDMSRLVISPTTVSSMIDAPALEPIKPDPSYAAPPSSNLVQSNYSLNSLPHENGQNIPRFSEPSLIPVSQYVPMSNSYPGVSPLMPHPYLNMSASGNMLSDLLPPITIAPSFPTSLALDVNPQLPHFNQAFQ